MNANVNADVNVNANVDGEKTALVCSMFGPPERPGHGRLRTVGLWVDRAEDWDGEESDVVSYRERGPVYQRGIVYYLRGDKVSE